MMSEALRSKLPPKRNVLLPGEYNIAPGFWGSGMPPDVRCDIESRMAIDQWLRAYGEREFSLEEVREIARRMMTWPTGHAVLKTNGDIENGESWTWGEPWR